ncbi:MAG TPA: glycosyltransferase family 2 protein, partial [Coriobacteriia bacterium]|nr:glycosyltransferase family 2 protein [Coriobacteriia bacterium]
MKVFIQIPCLNEEETLPAVLQSIPTEIEGVDEL